MDYRVRNLDEGLYVIDEQGLVQCYLVQGRDGALLFDSCEGGGEAFRQAVDSVARGPVRLVLSHSDRDHTGGAALFESPAMHPAEFSRFAGKGGGDTVPLALWEGEKIDLGGVCLEVVLIPGHTPGSIALLDVGRRRLFVGDSVSSAVIYMFGDGRSLRAYIESLKKLEAMANRFDTLHPAHGRPELGTQWLSKTRIAAEKLLRGELEARRAPRGLDCRLYRHEGVNFLY